MGAASVNSLSPQHHEECAAGIPVLSRRTQRCGDVKSLSAHARTHMYSPITSNTRLPGDQEAPSCRVWIHLYMNLFISEKGFRKGVHKVT